ncbi:MAG TPA: amino acid adenylation domain-containing protein, partial [Longimicrobiaceae bacterium]|nr:amino acid adenylation domain-containing protein [Longimicrobiaceae bacterium]
REAGHGRAEHRLPAVSTAALRSLARREGITPGTVVQGAWALLLARLSGEDDVVFGLAVSGRPAELPGVEEMVGMFVNTLPLRARIHPEAPAAEWLRSVQEAQAALRGHEHTPLVRVQGWSGVPAGEPLFESLLAFENFPVQEALGGTARDFEVEGWESSGETSYPLTLLALPEARLVLRLHYDLARVDAAAAARIPGHLAALLEGIAADPARPLSELPMLVAAERERVVVEWNRTGAELGPACVHELFRAQAARTPSAPAVACEGASLDYAALDAASDRLALHLATLGVGPEVRVGVCMERSGELMVALLAILKAGGAYVPLDPSYPADRLAFMLADSAVPVLVAQERLAGRVPEHGGATVLLDGAGELRGGDALSHSRTPALSHSPDNLAYVIYTSGSTGRPKGVMNSHRGIANRLLWMVGEYGLDASETVLQKTPLSFDVSVWELFVPLVCGARLVLARPGGHRDPAYLAELVERERVTTMHFVPPMLHAFLEEPRLEERCASLRRVACSGEALPRELQERFHARLPGVALHNLYGPTEAAVEVSYWHCRPREDRAVPIGRPLANTRLYVVDRGFQPVPVGVAGELLIGGVQVARGYLGRPELTAEKFVPDPFSPVLGARLYRTGDRARWLEDGELEFLGRIDHQVKVRGFRVEPGEVEAALLDHPGVRDAVVAARRDAPGETRLVGYFVPAPSGPDAAALRAHLAERLPEHMVPAALVPLDALPLSPNGKVDRKALPAPDAAPAAGGYVAPRTPAEELLAGIWSAVLGAGRVGAHDGFFELGGHSLLAMRVASRVREAFGAELPLAAVFEARTLAELAARVEALPARGARREAPPLLPADRTREIPLSFAQQRLWFLWQVDPASSAYVMPGALRLRGPLDAAALRASLREAVRRHEA